jgi:hypothetical protein
VCIVIMNNNGVYRGDEVNPTAAADPFAAGVREGRALREAAWRRSAVSGVHVTHARRVCARRWKRRSVRERPTLDQRGHRRRRRHRERSHHESQPDAKKK